MGCKRLESGTFSTPASARIGLQWIAARVLGGKDATPAAERFMERYRVQGFPTVMALTAEGDIVDPDLLEGQLRTAEELVEAMKAAEKEQEAFEEVRDALRAKGDFESLTELAKRYRARGNAAKALEVFGEAVETDPTPENYESLAAWANQEGIAEVEGRALAHLLETWPENERRMTWRVRQALLGIPLDPSREAFAAVLEARLDALEGLRAELEAEEASTDEAEIRLLMAEMLLEAGRGDEAQRHLAWIFREAEGTPPALRSHRRLARDAMRRADRDVAREHAAKILEHTAPGDEMRPEARMMLASLAYREGELEEVLVQYRALLEESPESDEAEMARGEIATIEEELAAEAGDEDEPDDAER